MERNPLKKVVRKLFKTSAKVEHKRRVAAEAEAESREFWEEHAVSWKAGVEEEHKKVEERARARAEYKRMLQVNRAPQYCVNRMKCTFQNDHTCI